MKPMKFNTSNTHDNWKTPKWLYDQLNYEFNFDFDPCPLNNDIDKFNGLEIEWGRSNFVNPPYSKGLKDKFIMKAYDEWKKGKTVVMLLPVHTSTKIFHSVIYYNAEIRFLEGRVKYFGTDDQGKLINGSPMHDSMLVIFKGEIK